MAGPKFTITPQNDYWVYKYFKEGFKDWQRFEEIEIKDRHNAEKKLDELYEKHSNEKRDSTGFSCALQGWVDAHIPKIIWQRALSAFRQEKYKEKNKIKNFGIKKEIYQAIWLYAQEVKMPMGKAIHELVKREHQKLIDESRELSWKKLQAGWKD